MGNGTATANRGGVPSGPLGCGYHTDKSVMQMVGEVVRHAKARRLEHGPKLWDRKHPGGSLLGTGKVIKGGPYENYGSLFDEVLQHDVTAVQLQCFDLMLVKGSFMGVAVAPKGTAHLTKWHHPETGRCGPYGRCRHIYEVCGTEVLAAHPLHTIVNGQVCGQNKGTVSSTGALEARVNERLAQALGVSQKIGDVLSDIANCMRAVTCECMHEHGFSTLPDWLGLQETTRTYKNKEVGRAGKKKTGRDFRRYFDNAIDLAQQHARARRISGGPLVFHKVGNNTGLQAEYIVASRRAMVAADDMVFHFNRTRTSQPEMTDTMALDILRRSWQQFIANPSGYVKELESLAFDWSEADAVSHYSGKQPFKVGSWTASPWQIHQAVEADVLFNCTAFHHVRPRAYLERTEAWAQMTEPWRHLAYDDPWDTDLGFYECLHCNQYSKTKYCTHVAAVTLIEKILPGLPRHFQTEGLDSHVDGHRIIVRKDRRGKDQPVSASDSRNSRQRFSSQSPRRKVKNKGEATKKRKGR